MLLLYGRKCQNLLLFLKDETIIKSIKLGSTCITVEFERVSDPGALYILEADGFGSNNTSEPSVQLCGLTSCTEISFTAKISDSISGTRENKFVRTTGQKIVLILFSILFVVA